MAYDKTLWENGVTPVNADNMNKIEDELESLDTGKISKYPKITLTVNQVVSFVPLTVQLTDEQYSLIEEQLAERGAVIVESPDLDISAVKFNVGQDLVQSYADNLIQLYAVDFTYGIDTVEYLKSYCITVHKTSKQMTLFQEYALKTPSATLTENELVGVGVTGEQLRVQLGEGLALEGSARSYTLKASGGGAKLYNHNVTFIVDSQHIVLDIISPLENEYDETYLFNNPWNLSMQYEGYSLFTALDTEKASLGLAYLSNDGIVFVVYEGDEIENISDHVYS